jgi:hypothetical protein
MCSADDEERPICGTCNGSGEGRVDGSVCTACNGSGESPGQCEDDDYDGGDY